MFKLFYSYNYCKSTRIIHFITNKKNIMSLFKEPPSFNQGSLIIKPNCISGVAEAVCWIRQMFKAFVIEYDDGSIMVEEQQTKHGSGLLCDNQTSWTSLASNADR